MKIIKNNVFWLWLGGSLLIVGGFFAVSFLIGKLAGDHYNPITKRIICSNYELCLHESAHKMDWELGHISNSRNFQQAVHLNAYINAEYPEIRTPFREKMALFPGIGVPRSPMTNHFLIGEFTLAGGWGGYGELYASMVEWTGGDFRKIPPEYQQFFNWSLLEAILKRTGFLIPTFP